MHKQITKFIHDLLSSDAVRVGGHQVDSIAAAKAWCRDVAEGRLVVGAPVEDAPAPQEPVK